MRSEACVSFITFQHLMEKLRPHSQRAENKSKVRNLKMSLTALAIRKGWSFQADDGHQNNYNPVRGIGFFLFFFRGDPFSLVGKHTRKRGQIPVNTGQKAQ